MITVLWNAAAGGGGKPNLEQRITDAFLRIGVHPRIVAVAAGLESERAIESAVAASSVVVAAGGDGTVNRIAARLLNSSATLGILPLGTLNHLAKDLGIPLDLDAAAATIAAGRSRRIDVGRVNDSVFLNNASIGIYPDIVVAREELRRHGHAKWTAMAVATLRVLRRYRGVHVRIAAEGRHLLRRTPFVVVANNEYTIDGINLGGRASLDGGRLFVYLTPRLRARELPRLLLKGLAGRASSSGAFEILATPDASVDTLHARRIRVALDGEVWVMKPPLEYRIAPLALNVLIP